MNNCGFNGYWWIIILILIIGMGSCGNFCGNNNSCGCGCN